MKRLAAFVSLALPPLLLPAGCGGASGPTITGNQVVVTTPDIEFHFTRQETFADTFMVFGGAELDHDNAISRITIAGLSLEDARPIYAEYPDFHTCKSAGAPLAQAAIQQLDIVPASAEIQDELSGVLADHEASLRDGGDRVCVKLRGGVLELTAAKDPESNTDLLAQLPPQLRHDYYLVESAEIQDAQSALGAR